MCDGLNAANPTTAINQAIKKITDRKGHKTEADLIELGKLKCEAAIWWDENGNPEIPKRVFRAAIEAAARKTKEGPNVREGLVVTGTQFQYDTAKYGTSLDELIVTTQFTVDGVMSGRRVPVTRARFDCPWSAVVDVDVDPELVDKPRLEKWVELAGRRLGIGAWRPAKSGEFGTFALVSLEEV